MTIFDDQITALAGAQMEVVLNQEHPEMELIEDDKEAAEALSKLVLLELNKSGWELKRAGQTSVESLALVVAECMVRYKHFEYDPIFIRNHIKEATVLAELLLERGVTCPK